MSVLARAGNDAAKTKTQIAATADAATNTRLRRQVAVVCALVALLLVSSAVLLQFGQSDARRQLEDRFTLRMGLGADFVRSYLDQSISRAVAVAEQTLTDETLAPDALQRVSPSLGYQVAVLLDSKGTLMEVVPYRADILGTDIGSKYAHLSQALTGVPAVSGVVSSAAEGLPVIAIATPFDTPFGRRVLSGGFKASDTPLGAYLRAAVPSTVGTVYLVDTNNNVVASNQTTPGGPDGAPTLLGALADVSIAGGHGFYDDADGTGSHYYSVHPIGGAPLRILATIATSSLYTALHGPTEWLPWVVLACLAGGAFYLMFVLRRLGLTQRELRLASIELERSNRELESFATIASHDLQEPLRKIQAFGERLETKTRGQLDEEAGEYLERMQDAAGRMQQLIQELLSYSRVTTRPEPPQQVDLNRVLREILEDLEVRIQSTGGEVIVNRLPTVMASPLQMRQLFQNLVANALKFHREDVPPVIIVGADTSGKADWTITVIDNGIGFDEQYAERIFAPFQRLHGRTEFEGTGMGLAITRRIVERHGGRVTAHSEPGNGATFVMEFPRQMIVPQMSSSRRAGQPLAESAQAG